MGNCRRIYTEVGKTDTFLHRNKLFMKNDTDALRNNNIASDLIIIRQQNCYLNQNMFLPFLQNTSGL